jgi:hypothetical protein
VLAGAFICRLWTCVPHLIEVLFCIIERDVSPAVFQRFLHLDLAGGTVLWYSRSLRVS